MATELFESDMISLESLEGKLLVATHNLDGTCFEKALIYICAHDEKGAIGIVVNHIIGNVNIKDLIGNLNIKQPTKHKKIPVIFGGPIEQDRVMILSVDKEQEKNFNKVQSTTIYTEGEAFLKDYVSGKHKVKFLLIKGFSAWDAEQLEHEINENVWLVAPASLDILFSQKVRNKWQRVIEAIGVKDLTCFVHQAGNA